MSDTPKLEWVKQPSQERSQQTMERLLHAAELVISEKGYEKATVAEIVKVGKSSVGAFYSRFRDKEALLVALGERFVIQAKATVEMGLQPHLWDSVPIPQLCRMLLGFGVRIMAERHHMIAAIDQRARNIGESVIGNILIEVLAEGVTTLLSHRGLKIGRDDAAEALNNAVVVGIICIRDFSLPDGGRPENLPEEQTLDHLTEMLITHLNLVPIQGGQS